jgi:hypothetical protein
MTLPRRTLLAAAFATPALSRGIAQPRPVNWPNGARLAVSVTMIVLCPVPWCKWARA